MIDLRPVLVCDLCQWFWLPEGKTIDYEHLPEKCPKCATKRWNEKAERDRKQGGRRAYISEEW